MIELTRPGAWLLQQAATLPDTVVAKTVAVRGWFETATDVASGVLVLILLALVVAMVPLSWLLWRKLRKARELLDNLQAEVTPLLRHASGVAKNLEQITASLRNDVEKVNATIASANRRLHRAMDVTETRLSEFSALIDVAQEEAEQAFVSTAAAVRGVRTGVAALGGDGLDGDSSGPEGGDGDGDDDDSFDSAGKPGGERNSERSGRRGATARPRIRPRRGARD